MKHVFRILLLTALGLALWQPAHAQKTVRVNNATGLVADPADFFAANAEAISASISAATGLIPFEAPSSALGDTVAGAEFLLWSPDAVAPLDDGFAGWVNASTFRTRLGLGTGDTPLFAGVQVFGQAQALTLSLGLNGTVLSGAGVGGITLQLPGVSGTLLTTTGNGGGLSALNASAITTGTLDAARLPTQAVQTARTISTTAPLTGGGDLSANRTLGVTTATESAVGVVELATAAEAITGTDTTRAPHAAAARAALSAYVDPIAATRPAGAYLWSDGFTANRGVVYSNATRQNIAGMPVVQIAFEMVQSTGGTFWGSSNTTSFAGVTYRLELSAGTSGGMVLTQMGASSGTDFRRFTWANFATAYASGQRIRGIITITQGTTNPVVEIGGVNVSSNFTATTAGTPPQWLDASLPSAFQITGFNWPAGEAPLVTPILGALSSAEKAEYFATGRFPYWVNGGGSAVQLYTTASAVSRTNEANAIVQMSLGDNSQTGFSSESGSRPGSSGSFYGRYTAAVNGTGIVVRFGIAPGLQRPGRALVYRFWARSSRPSGVPQFFLGENNSGGFAPVNLTSLTTDWQEFVGVSTGYLRTNFNVLAFQLNANFLVGDTLDIDDVEIYDAGALTLPGIQGVATTRDLSLLGSTQYNQGRLVGVRPVLAQPAPRNTAILPLSTTGAFLTLGSANPLAFGPQRIIRAEVIVDTAGADLTFRRNSSSTNDIVTALTDIPTANTATALTLIAAQTRLALGETVWASLSAGTGFIIVETADTL